MIFFRLCEHIRKLKEDFARVAPYLVADVVDCFQRVTLYTPVKANLLVYHLFFFFVHAALHRIKISPALTATCQNFYVLAKYYWFN